MHYLGLLTCLTLLSTWDGCRWKRRNRIKPELCTVVVKQPDWQFLARPGIRNNEDCENFI